MPHTPIRVVPVGVDVAAGSDGSTTITCSPNPAAIAQGASHVLLVFTLNTPGYRFRTAKAIVLNPALEDFPYASWTISDTQAALYDRNKVADTVNYTVTVVDESGLEHSADPEIKNGGGGVGGGGDC